MNVAVVGLGDMGLPMALRLVAAGVGVRACDLRPERAAACTGAAAAADPAEAASGADAAILMLPTEDAVWDAAVGTRGALATMPAGSILLQMSTVSPAFVRRLGGAARARGVAVLDAPVARGAAAAARGELAVLVGADPKDLERARPILDALASSILHVGAVGSGSAAKLVNNLVVGACLGALAEGLATGVRAGVRLDALVDALELGSADSWVLRNLIPNALHGRYATGSKVDIMLKDVSLAAGLARDLGVPLAVTAAARSLLSRAHDLGFGRDDSTSVLRVLERDAGVSLRIDDITARRGQEVHGL